MIDLIVQKSRFCQPYYGMKNQYFLWFQKFGVTIFSVSMPSYEIQNLAAGRGWSRSPLALPEVLLAAYIDVDVPM